ncbi:beta-glucosidase 2-like [Dendrobium catenatum]|uniref:beta-glucosidase 2-like n=1 Tax=Dendrobium catenatum TaxID=906689 RepID=UPI0009F3F48F|nr:beta-glucosidase 2-like [Dendrobium catenatum]
MGTPIVLRLMLLVFCEFALLVGLKAISQYSRDDFPSEFIFGAGTSAYQYEGAAAEEGRTPSIWDTYAHEGNMKDGSTGDVASDGYHKYKEDIKLMSDTGLQAYRFSISWSRLIPKGRGEVNSQGIEYYNNVIDELIKNGIQPHVTLHHYDLPQVLQDEYGGWLSPKIIDDFKEFADVCFREFGDRVSYWTTFNEANVIALYAYDYGVMPPKRCSYPFGVDCVGGNSTTEPYIVAHNIILSHSAVVELYRRRYQAKQKGKIGINLWTLWCYPLHELASDEVAAKRAIEFLIGWFLNPIMFGDYPEIMKVFAGSRLPSFSKSESQQVKGAFDFLGINYYFSLFVTNNFNALNTNLRDFSADMFANFTGSTNQSGMKDYQPLNLPVNPRGLTELLKYFKEKYGNPPLYIQENGYGVEGEDKLKDMERVSYLSGFIGCSLEALRNGSDLRGYFVWSFVDLFELMAGYQLRIGLYHVDFDKDRERVPKLSAYWYSQFLKNGKLVSFNNGEKIAEAQYVQQVVDSKLENGGFFSG